MNKACAAGTGAFLEKQAARLGLDITEFGPTALRAARPPDLDWTCTVFSESAAVYYQQNNVPIEDLCAGLCLASGKNYLNKNVASREISDKVTFQGAVASSPHRGHRRGLARLPGAARAEQLPRIRPDRLRSIRGVVLRVCALPEPV
jgi:hypothetical protein